MKPEMRLLGPALIVASLVLGSGGVALRSHAASLQALDANDQFGMTLIRRQQTSCEAGSPARLDLPRRVGNRRIVSLDTRGYNYSNRARPLRQVPASAAN